jgi:hypothetical protein
MLALILLANSATWFIGGFLYGVTKNGNGPFAA